MRSLIRTCLLLAIAVIGYTPLAVGAARLQSIQLSTDVSEDGFTAVNVRDVFDVSTPAIHSVVKVEDVRANSILKGVWVSIDAIAVPNYEIDAIEMKLEKSGPASAHISLSRPNNGWPPGNYRLDVYLESQPLGSKAFSITEPAAQEPPAQPPSAPPTESKEAIAEKLKALEAARQAGILSDEEYRTKKAELEARLTALAPVLDERAREKLQALESAYQAGILTKQEYEQKRALIVGAAGPSQPTGQAVPVAASPTLSPGLAPQPAGRAGRTYSHPAGFSFWYPMSWNITDQDGTLQLTPADAATSAEGPLELFFLATESIAGTGIRTPTDQAVIEHLDGQVKSLSPILVYTREPSTIQTRVGPGAVLVWRAKSPDGQSVVARVFVTLVKESVVILVGMGLQERIDARDADLRDLFQSVTTGQPQAPRSAPVVVETPRMPGALGSAGKTGSLSGVPYGQGVQAPAQPASTPSQQAPPVVGAGVSPKVGGKTYRHVIGFTFWYPADWTVKELDDTLQLVPPDPGQTANGDPTELYFLTGDSVAGEGITRTDDPRVIQYMDQAVAQLAPTLKRTSPPGSIPTTGGQGIVMDWQGNASSGETVCARAYVSLIKDYGVSLIGLCLKERLASRETQLQRIFSSFAFGQAQRDMQLVGTWTFLTTQSITNWSPFETHYSRAQLAADHSATLVIEADGTWRRTDQSQMIAGAGGVWLESNETKESKGQWYAGNAALYLIWEDKSWQDYKYEIRPTADGTRLLLVSEGKGELWERAR